MLRDEEFSKKAAVDRYGRKLEGNSGRRELERFYRVGEDEEGQWDEDEEVEVELRRVEREYDPAREGGFSSSSSEEAEEEEEEEEEESSADEEEEERGETAEAMEGYGFADQQAGQDSGVPMGDISSRIAVVNLDWDNIRAADLMAVFSSFVPASGRILKASVYPSEFGMERMEREEIEGPPKDIFATAEVRENGASSSSEDEDGVQAEDEDENIKKSILQEDKGEEFDSAKLRRYQLERLRYCYAVLTCSSPTVAKQIYDAVDGTEYLTTANFFDLRFIPDDVDFSEDRPRDECERIPDGYRPNEFVTDALQHSKVRLTWDADDGARKEVQRRAFAGSRAEIDENDLKAYLGSDSSEDEPEETVVADASTMAATDEDGVAEIDKVPSKASKKERERQRMRTLLGLGDTPASSNKRSKAATGGPVGDMQITFSSGLSAAPTTGGIFENEPEREETTVEKYVRKEKERKARRKERMKGARNGETTAADDTPHSKEAEEAPPEADLGFDDPFFIAPADDHAAASAQRKADRLAKREQRAADEAASSAQRAELQLLMLDDKSSDVKHFDMNEIQKAQKAAGKKGKKKDRKRKEREWGEGEQDGFEMDVKDPRFSSLFESHEFAIDPTNPRFKGTEGMRALLEEGRRKRGRGGEDGEGGMDSGGRGERKRTRVVVTDTDAGDGEDLKKLVEKVKTQRGISHT